MIKNSFILLLLLMFLLSANSFAQVPGYMGKRFTIGYSNLLAPNILAKATHNTDKISLYHSVNINYIITKQREICVVVKYNNRDVLNSNYSGSQYSGIKKYEKLSSLEYSLAFKKFNRARFAPIGAYSKWEGLYISSWMNYEPYTSTYTDYYNGAKTTTSYSGGKVILKGFGVAYSRGRQRVFNDKFVVDFGIRGTLLGLFEQKTNSSYESSLISDAQGALNLNPIFNVYAGIGFLAF